MIWRRILAISIVCNAVCALVFWVTAALGFLSILPETTSMNIWTAIWVSFWIAIALGGVLPLVTAFAALRLSRSSNSGGA
jgi:hypothetical protein